MDPITIGLIISAIAGLGGTAIQYNAQRDAQKRQQRAIEDAAAEQAEFTKRRNAQVVSNAEAFTPQRTGEQLARVVAPAQERLEGVAQQAAEVSGTVARPAGAANRYDTESAKRAAAELERAIAEAGMAARAGAGRRLMFEQGLTGAQGASDVDNITSLMEQAARRSQTRVQQAGNVNPNAMLAGGLLQAGGAVAGGMYGAGASATPAVANQSLGNFGTLTGNPMLAGARSQIPASSFGFLTGMR